MKLYVCRLILLVSLAVFPFYFAYADTVREKRIVVSSSLSSASVRSFAEDHMGRMWIGTTRGLDRYDIHSYYNYFHTEEAGSIPDNEIHTLYCDSRGRIWISTPGGIAYRTEQDLFHTIPEQDQSDVCISMVETHDGRMVFKSIYSLSVYNQEEDRLDRISRWNSTSAGKLFTDNRGNVWLLKESHILCYEPEHFSVIDSLEIGFTPTASRMMKNGDIWLCAEGSLGVTRLSTSTKELHHAYMKDQMSSKIGSVKVAQIQEYSSGNVLFLDQNNRLFYVIGTELISQENSAFPFEVSGKKIQNIYIDSKQNVWIGYNSAGYEVKYDFGSQFNRNHLLVSFFKDKPVSSMAKDASDNLYLMVENEALYRYSSAEHNIQKMSVNGNSALTKALSSSLGLFVDKDNDLWVGNSSENSLFCFGVNGTNLSLKGKFPSFFAMDFTYDSNGRLWVSGVNNYLLRIDKSKMSYDRIQIAADGIMTIASSLAFMDGKIICGAYPVGIKSIDPVSFEVKDLVSAEVFSKVIKKGLYIPTSFYLDSNDDLWISTNSNGLICYRHEDHRMVPMAGLPCSDVASMIEDQNGNMWIGSADGLTKRSLKTGVITNYFKEDGIGGNQFFDRSIEILSDGTVVLGGMHGLTMVDPSLSFRVRDVELVFEDLKVNNTIVEPGARQPIDVHLSLLPDINLNSHQRNFSISFSYLDYNRDLSVNYKYKLEGYDKDWIDSGTINVATYSNVTPGKYKFIVRAVGKNGTQERESSLKVKINPTIWGTAWMKICYVILLMTVFLSALEITRKRKTEKDILCRAEMEKEQERRMNKMNMSFFANVAHEFRTPLTMIAGPVGELSSSSRIVGRDKDLLNVVKKSVNRMLQLVNQFMDFNKLENDTLRLVVTKGDIVKDLKYCMEMFSVNASQKSVAVGVHCLEESFEMWYDSDKLMKVISNLMSNALKFTPSGGSVSVSFDVVSDNEVRSIFSKEVPYHKYAKIVVTDTGIGIPEDKFEEVFKRYIQLDNQSKATKNIGTGIGLYYAKALVELHHGLIKAGSRSAGSGAVLTFVIPVDESAYPEEERTSEKLDQTRVYPIADSSLDVRESSNLSDDSHTVLVVDDDIDVANYLEILLSGKYRILKNYDGESALASAREYSPDIIISDVVMPGMTGYQLCEAVKSDIQLSHIPVILVTAKVTVENQVEGLEKGADAYVTKPFDPAYLTALVESMLKNRDMMREHITSSTNADDNIYSSLSSQDSRLLKDLYSLMESELANPEVDVEEISHKLKISRTKLYYKIKGLTGMTPSDFFRQYKLNRAAQLLSEGVYNVSEVSDMTGFANQSYFSTVFKKHFGVSPSEYKK